MKAKSLITGIAVGSIIGGLSALLFAPMSGQNMRSSVIQKYTDMKQSLENFADDAKQLTNKLRATAQTGKTAAKEISEELKQTVTVWRDDIEPHLKQLQEDIEKLQQLAKMKDN